MTAHSPDDRPTAKMLLESDELQNNMNSEQRETFIKLQS